MQPTDRVTQVPFLAQYIRLNKTGPNYQCHWLYFRRRVFPRSQCLATLARTGSSGLRALTENSLVRFGYEKCSGDMFQPCRGTKQTDVVHCSAQRGLVAAQMLYEVTSKFLPLHQVLLRQFPVVLLPMCYTKDVRNQCTTGKISSLVELAAL